MINESSKIASPGSKLWYHINGQSSENETCVGDKTGAFIDWVTIDKYSNVMYSFVKN